MGDGRTIKVEDRLELLELEGRYARTFDSRDGDAWAGLFTPNGIYRARGTRPGDRGRYEGRASLAEFCSNAPFDGIHLLHVPQFTIAGDTARARVHLRFVGTFRADGSTVDMIGYYDVAYARVDGQWFIDHRVTTTLRTGDGPIAAYPPGDGFDD